MIESAGIIIIDDSIPERKALCVRAYSNWDFPKGQLEAGESHLEAAKREVEEEEENTATGKLIQSNWQKTP